MKYYDKSPYTEDAVKDEETRAMESSIRDKVGTGNPFKVPDGYFDRLPELMLDKIDSYAQSPATKRKVLSTTMTAGHRKRLWWAAACTIAAIMTAGLHTYFTSGTNQEPDSSIANYKMEHRHLPADSSQKSCRPNTDNEQHITTIGNDSYVDEVADYAMMDNTDIIACLDE